MPRPHKAEALNSGSDAAHCGEALRFGDFIFREIPYDASPVVREDIALLGCLCAGHCADAADEQTLIWQQNQGLS